MCIICLEFQMDKLTIKEARRNFTEMALTIEEKHRQEVEDMLDVAEEAERMELAYYDPFSDIYLYRDEGSD